MKPFAIFNDIVTAAADEAIDRSKKLSAAGIVEPLYLYFKPSTETEDGQLKLVSDSETPPDGFQLATGEGLRTNVPYSNYWTWIRERSMRLPILAWGK